jgi:hypothetical protein
MSPRSPEVTKRVFKYTEIDSASHLHRDKVIPPVNNNTASPVTILNKDNKNICDRIVTNSAMGVCR